jgi:hypothetical protein
MSDHHHELSRKWCNLQAAHCAQMFVCYLLDMDNQEPGAHTRATDHNFARMKKSRKANA